MIDYCDADWAGDQIERRSTTGYVFIMQGAAISWNTRRQPTIALSSTEPEFMSMVAAIQEALWLKRFEKEIFPNAEPTVKLFCDNKSAIHLAVNKSYQARTSTKHIEVKNYFIREHLINNDIELIYKRTDDMTADIFTKIVNSIKLNKFIPELGISE